MARRKTNTKPKLTESPITGVTIPTPYVELGSTGLKRWGGQLQDEFLTELRGQRGRKVIREMCDNSSVVGGLLFAVKQFLRGVSITVEPGGTSPQHEEAAAFLDSARNDMAMTWADTLSDILSFLPYGWSFHEVVLKKREGAARGNRPSSRYADGKIGWRKWAIRGQDTLDRWDIDEQGGVRAMVQNDPSRERGGGNITIPIEKALLFRTESNRNSPEGRSILRSAYVPFYYAKKIRALEGIGIERDLAGLPQIRAPQQIMTATAGAAEKALFEHLKQMGERVRNDEQSCVIMPSDTYDNGTPKFVFELTRSGGAKQFDTDKVLMRYNTEQLIVVLADFILLGHEKVGSFALSSDKTDIFQLALTGWMSAILDVVNRFGVPALLAMNGYRLDPLPFFQPGPIRPPRLKDLADPIMKLAGAGMMLFPDEELENYLRALEGWPAVPEDRPEQVKQQQDMLGLNEPAEDPEEASGKRENRRRALKAAVEIFKEWNEADHPRGKTTAPSTPGSFRPAGGIELYSQNIADEASSTPEKAERDLRHIAMARYQRVCADIDRELGLKGTQTPALGDWNTGSEASIMAELEGEVEWDTLRYAACLKGFAGYQKAVGIFQQDPSGTDLYHDFTLPERNWRTVRDLLGSVGIENRTLIPGADGTRVVLLDPGGALADQVQALAGRYRINVTSKIGRADFIGDFADRAAAQGIFTREIEAYVSQHPDRRHARVRDPERQWLSKIAALAQAVDVIQKRATALREWRERPLRL